MKFTDMVFWLFLGSLAVFYLVKGNEMHKQREEILFEKKADKDIIK